MELSNIIELIHAVSDSNLTQFNLQDGNLNISMSAEKTIVQQAAANTDAALSVQYQPVIQHGSAICSAESDNWSGNRNRNFCRKCSEISSCRNLLCSFIS